MNSHHASLGRRTLEEIRQKRATERLSKTSSGSDFSQTSIDDASASKKTEIGARLSEADFSGLVAQIKDLQKKNADLEERNSNLNSKLQRTAEENSSLMNRINDLEVNTVPSLRKALKDVAMEKDAAVVSREDLSAQVRSLKKRMKQAEEDQLRAEEDAASLRAELNNLQHQVSFQSHGTTPISNLEAEVSNLKSELQKELSLRHQERAKWMSEKNELEEKLGEASGKKENQNYDYLQVHELAVAVERLESTRQKLLMEVDSQSSEIERLFEENSSLLSLQEEMSKEVKEWEKKFDECLGENEELRKVLNKIRSEKMSLSVGDVGILKGELMKEQSRSEALSAEVMQLAAKLQLSKQGYNGLLCLYKPVLRNIESSLIKIKRDAFVST